MRKAEEERRSSGAVDLDPRLEFLKLSICVRRDQGKLSAEGINEWRAWRWNGGRELKRRERRGRVGRALTEYGAPEAVREGKGNMEAGQ